MPRNIANSAFMKPFVILALPGMYLFYKYNQYKQQQQEQSRRKVTERELAHLNHKIDKLLTKLEENEPELATSQEDECVICVNAKATMQTSPCGHRVVCRKCFVKTIQMAVSQRLLPLRCVICRAKILRLKQSSGGGHGGLVYSKSWLVPSSASSYSVSARSWSASSCKSGSSWGSAGSSGSGDGKPWVPSSASQYSMANSNRSVPNSASLYSMTSGSSSLSGMSSVSSTTNSSAGSRSSSTNVGGRLGTVRQPTGSLRKSQQYSMKIRIQEYNDSRHGIQADKPSRLPPIIEFQREYRLGKERASSSTRIRCAQKIVTQLETTPLTQSDKVRKKKDSSKERSSSSSSTTTAAAPSSSTTTTTSSSSAAGAAPATTTSSFFRCSPLRPSNKDEKKRDKSVDKRIAKLRDESREKRATSPSGEAPETKAGKPEGKDKKADKKESKAEKKKSKKESGDNKKEDGKPEKKDAKSEKKSGKKDGKGEGKGEKGKN